MILQGPRTRRRSASTASAPAPSGSSRSTTPANSAPSVMTTISPAHPGSTRCAGSSRWGTPRSTATGAGQLNAVFKHRSRPDRTVHGRGRRESRPPPSGDQFWLVLPKNLDFPWNDQRVRQAMALAVDRRKINEIVYGDPEGWTGNDTHMNGVNAEFLPRRLERDVERALRPPGRGWVRRGRHPAGDGLLPLLPGGAADLSDRQRKPGRGRNQAGVPGAPLRRLQPVSSRRSTSPSAGRGAIWSARATPSSTSRASPPRNAARAGRLGRAGRRALRRADPRGRRHGGRGAASGNSTTRRSGSRRRRCRASCSAAGATWSPTVPR